MIKPWPTKDPNSNLRYYFDWSAFVTAEGSPIASYAIAIDSPPDASLVLGLDADDGSMIMVWISGGTEGQTYTVRCRVTLANGTVEDESRSLTIESH
jgi:hypothetical protein